jgi:hypothetical protein
MKSAAAIFVVTGLAYLCWAVVTIISEGLHSWLGLFVEAAFTASLLYIAYGLFRARVAARWSAVFASACLVAGCGFVLFDVFLPLTLWHWHSVPNLTAVPSWLWGGIAMSLTVSVAHLAAIGLLLLAKPAHPNASLKAQSGGLI